MNQPPQEKTLQDLIGVLRRRWRVGLCGFLAVLVPAVLVALLLPATYRSTGTILIEQQEIPQDLVRTTITSFADQRIELISQRVMTTTNLLGIIRAHGLYPDDFDTKPREVIIERMRGDISREMISAEVVDPRSGQPTAATIAFTVGFDSRSPQTAALVANELTSLYLQENSESRRAQAAEASSFLSGEAGGLAREIAVLETRLAEFKQRNLDRLPELAGLNQQLYQRTETDLADIRRQRGVLEERRIYLQSELAQLNPSAGLVVGNGQVVLEPRDRLRALQAQLAAMQGIYSDRHPMVIRTQGAIDALEAELGVEGQGSPQALRAELARLEALRGSLIDRYTATHPEVERVDRQMSALEAEIEQAERDGARVAPGREYEQVASNPAYVQLRAQDVVAEAEIAALREREREVAARQADLEERLTQTPLIERDYTALTRDLETARARYQQIRFGERAAQTAENLELDAKGERFTLIEPPLVPQQPVSPNRPFVLFIGLFAALGVAVGLVALREELETSVHGPTQLQAIVGAPPIGVIPRIVTDADRARTRRRLTFGAVGATAALVLLLGAAHSLVIPLDELWFRAIRRIGA